MTRVSDPSAAGPLPEPPRDADEPVKQSPLEAAIPRHVAALLSVLSQNETSTPDTPETRAAKFANSSSDGAAPRLVPSPQSEPRPRYLWDLYPPTMERLGSNAPDLRRTFIEDAFRMIGPEELPQSGDGSYVRRDVFNLSGMNVPIASSDARPPSQEASPPPEEPGTGS